MKYENIRDVFSLVFETIGIDCLEKPDPKLMTAYFREFAAKKGYTEEAKIVSRFVDETFLNYFRGDALDSWDLINQQGDLAEQYLEVSRQLEKDNAIDLVDAFVTALWQYMYPMTAGREDYPEDEEDYPEDGREDYPEDEDDYPEDGQDETQETEQEDIPEAVQKEASEAAGEEEQETYPEQEQAVLPEEEEDFYSDDEGADDYTEDDDLDDEYLDDDEEGYPEDDEDDPESPEAEPEKKTNWLKKKAEEKKAKQPQYDTVFDVKPEPVLKAPSREKLKKLAPIIALAAVAVLAIALYMSGAFSKFGKITVINGIKANASDFTFPESSSRNLTYEELTKKFGKLDDESKHIECQVAINEIYCRYGYSFKANTVTAEETRNRFDGKAWYEEAKQYYPGDGTDLYSSYMNEYERANINLLLKWKTENDFYAG